MDNYSIIVSDKFNDFSVKDFLINNGFSLEIIKKIKFGNISVNQSKLKSINLKLKTNDVINICLLEKRVNPYAKPAIKPLKILFEDECLLAVVKEKGILTHTSKHNKTLSLEEIVCGYYFPKPFVFRAINRLDKDTSGIILIAKDMLTASLLNEQMKNGLIEKNYTALVLGIPENSCFSVEKPIKKLDDNSIKRIVCPDGDYAKTEFQLIKILDNKFSLLNAKPITGRTHQIRVHLSHLNLPLYADSLYGTPVKDKTYTLHASKLTFFHPFTKNKIELTDDITI